jgi:hypothetical protein
MRPDSARKFATWLLDAAFGTEIEAFLVAFMMEDPEHFWA